MKRSHAIIFIAPGIAVGIALSNISILPWHWEMIQTLKRTDGTHVATLSRLMGGIDSGYKISLDGTTIWSSGDTSPHFYYPCREVLTWDETQKFLVFELAGTNVFAFNLAKRIEVPVEKLGQVRVIHYDLQDIGYEARKQIGFQDKPYCSGVMSHAAKESTSTIEDHSEQRKEHTP